MIFISDDDRRRAFSVWLRSGRLPLAAEDGIERKFNPWHDSTNGRLTFVGAGRHFGAGVTSRTNVDKRVSRFARHHEAGKLPAGTGSIAKTPSTEHVQIDAHTPALRESGRQPQSGRPSPQSNPIVEFARGAAEGVYNTAVGAAEATYSALTTNPLRTAINSGQALAGKIDAVIAAEDIPARVQMSRATDAIAHASARDLGRATGGAVGNVALMVAPGAALSRVTTLRRLRVEGPRGVTYEPLEMQWIKENLGRDSPAKRYNDGAPGTRPNQAPTLMRTMPDGSKRPVKFDGVQNGYFIDRKVSIRDQARARAQVLRQSEALAEQGLIGIYEVTNQMQRVKAAKLLKKMKVRNIKARIVEP